MHVSREKRDTQRNFYAVLREIRSFKKESKRGGGGGGNRLSLEEVTLLAEYLLLLGKHGDVSHFLASRSATQIFTRLNALPFPGIPAKQAYPPRYCPGFVVVRTVKWPTGRNTTKRNGPTGASMISASGSGAEPGRFVFLLTADKDEGAGQKYDSQRPTGHPGVDRYVDSASS